MHTAPAKSETWAPVFAPGDFGSGAVAGTKHRILIVEDDFLVAGELEYALQSAGFEVAGTASSASEAIELARTQQPTIAIMDIRLAGTRDGVDTARRLMSDYVVAGLLMTPTNATFTEARDAILAAASAFDADDMLVMAAAFAGRGLGSCAVSPTTSSRTPRKRASSTAARSMSSKVRSWTA